MLERFFHCVCVCVRVVHALTIFLGDVFAESTPLVFLRPRAYRRRSAATIAIIRPANYTPDILSAVACSSLQEIKLFQIISVCRFVN